MPTVILGQPSPYHWPPMVFVISQRELLASPSDEQDQHFAPDPKHSEALLSLAIWQAAHHSQGMCLQRRGDLRPQLCPRKAPAPEPTVDSADCTMVDSPAGFRARKAYGEHSPLFSSSRVSIPCSSSRATHAGSLWACLLMRVGGFGQGVSRIECGGLLLVLAPFLGPEHQPLGPSTEPKALPLGKCCGLEHDPGG